MRCPRRDETFGADERFPGEDYWRFETDTCSYCGSMNPDRFMEKVEAGVEVGPTDKNYKVYVEDSGNGKFYFQHLSVDQMKRFVDLYNERKINVGYPGHFYVKPFFMRSVKKADADADA